MVDKKKKSYPSNATVRLSAVVVEVEDELKGKINAPALYQHFLKTYCKPGDHLSIEIKNRRPKRSVSQNNFYHLYLSLVALSSGHTMTELKSWVRDHVLSKGITEVFGKKVRVTESSADLNISEFCEMMNRIEILTEIPIPDPGPFNLPLTLDQFGHLKQKQKEKYSSFDSKIKKETP